MATRTTYNEQTARQLAEQLAEAVRGMSHLTRDAGSVQTPMEAHQVLGETVTGRVPAAAVAQPAR